jgi:uncharacterized protein (TIGR02246 family)
MKGLITVLAVLVVVGLAFFLYRTPTAPPEMSEGNLAQIQAEVEAARQEHRDAMMAGDVEGILAHLTSDAVQLGPGYRYVGTEIRDYMQRTFTEASLTSWESQPIETWVHGDAVYAIVRDDMTVTFGEQAMTLSTHTFTRWVKEDGQWKLSYVFSSPVDAPPEG